MQAIKLVNNVTAGMTSSPFNVRADQPTTLTARGLAGAETVKLQVSVSGTFMDVYKATALVQLTPTNNLLGITEPGTYRVVASATAGALFVEATTSDVRGA